MACCVDLHSRPDHRVLADMHLVAIQDGALDIQIDMIADINVLTVAAMEGRLNDRILTDLSQQLPQDGFSFGRGCGQVVALQQFLGLLALSLQFRIETVVASFPRTAFSLFRFSRAFRDSCLVKRSLSIYISRQMILS
jgi:hypothetical protein